MARVLLTASRRFQSITLRASAHHLLTDVWTSAGVLVALGAVYLTGWDLLDPLVGLGVAGSIVFTGFRIVRDSISGLMDTALPVEERDRVRGILERHAVGGIE